MLCNCVIFFATFCMFRLYFVLAWSKNIHNRATCIAHVLLSLSFQENPLSTVLQLSQLCVSVKFCTDFLIYIKHFCISVFFASDLPPCPFSPTALASSCFEFDITSVVRSKVAMAELWLYWTGEEPSNTNHTLVINQLSGHGSETSRTIAVQYVPPSQSAGWITVDIKHTVRRWRTHSHHDQVIQILCETCDSNSILPLGAHSRYRPFIVIRVADEKKTRKRKNVNCDANTTDCCRQHFHLRFLDLGWDWVISPRGFDANFCRGSCTNFNSPALTHTSIMQTLRSNSPAVNIPRPCCSPRMTGSLSMIYMDDHGKFYTVDLPEMKILSCGCS